MYKPQTAQRRCSKTDGCTTGQLLLVSEADFHARLVQFFRPFESSSPMDWECVQKSTSHFAPYFEIREFLDLHFDYVFALFEKFRVRDKAVIVFCVQKYCRFKLHCCGFRIGEFSVEVTDSGVPPYEHFLVPRYVDQMLSRPFLYRDLKAVRRILRYVAPVFLEWEDLSFYADQVIESITKDPFLHHTVFFQLVEVGRVEQRRLKLTLMAVDFVLQGRMQNSHDAISGFKLFLQAIPDPYVTWLEIYRFLRRMSVNPDGFGDTYVRGFLESCARLFPECLRVLKPRSLRHLARCEVRRGLGRNHSLPHGVCELGLPTTLEDYVLLQEGAPVTRPLSSDRVFALRPDIQSRDAPTMD